jgi:HK97 gp10 family phage protein
MSDEFSISINTRELEEALKALPEKVAKKYMMKALQTAGNVLLDAMVSLAPERTDEKTPNGDSLPPGILKYDLHTQTILQDDGGKVRVGPSGIAGHVARWQNDGWMLTGHKPGKKRIHEVADQPGKFFMQRAFDESGEAALEAFTNDLADSIESGAK